MTNESNVGGTVNSGRKFYAFLLILGALPFLLALGPNEIYIDQSTNTSYVLSHKIGEGFFGQVWVATEEATGVQYAMKFMRPEVSKEEVRSQALPVEQLASEKGNNWNYLARYYRAQQLVGEDGREVDVLRSDLIDGKNVEQLIQEGAFSLNTLSGVNNVKMLLRDALLGILELAKSDYSHNDLTAKNIMFDKSKVRFLLVDLGSASVQGELPRGENPVELKYAPPEFFAASPRNHPWSSDIFNLGVIVAEAMSGRDFFVEFTAYMNAGRNFERSQDLVATLTGRSSTPNSLRIKMTNLKRSLDSRSDVKAAHKLFFRHWSEQIIKSSAYPYEAKNLLSLAGKMMDPNPAFRPNLYDIDKYLNGQLSLTRCVNGFL